MTTPPEPEREVATTPRWLYVIGGLVIVLALAFVVMHFASGGVVRH